MDDQQRIGGWLRDAYERYGKVAKPLTRRKRGVRTAAASATVAQPVTSPANEPAAPPRREREREKVGSGK